MEGKLWNVEESTLTETERLGLAACRLNLYQWDDYIGEKPMGFDEMTAEEKNRWVLPALDLIKGQIGEAWISRCWWRFWWGKTFDEWCEEWPRFKKAKQELGKAPLTAQKEREIMLSENGEDGGKNGGEETDTGGQKRRMAIALTFSLFGALLGGFTGLALCVLLFS